MPLWMQSCVNRLDLLMLLLLILLCNSNDVGISLFLR
jgi:hypothetical protein